MQFLNQVVKTQLNQYLDEIGNLFMSDVLTIVSAIRPGLDNQVDVALGGIAERKNKLTVILDTPGGIVEVVERMVITIRDKYKYDEVVFIVPNRAMSAGTIFVMAGDRILMSHSSCLGPIDPQVEKKDGDFVPALSYITQYERLVEKSAKGELTNAEYALFLKQFDLAVLHQYEQARDLSKELLIKWLSVYKFKDWVKTPDEKKRRAEEIAILLSNHERWHSHGRPIGITTLVNEIRLRIEDIGTVEGLSSVLDKYWGLLLDFVQQKNFPAFVHTKGYF